jgi:hypothetical protein
VPHLIRRGLCEIGEDLQKQFEEHGYEIMSDHQREQLKLPPRGPDGWTADEILAWEQYRRQMMLKPVIMVSKARIRVAGGIRENPGHIVSVKPDPREEIR